MALSVGELVALLKLDKSHYEAGLKSAEKGADDLAKKSDSAFGKISKSLTTVGSALTKYVTLPLAAVAAGAVKVAAAFETQQVAFSTLLQDVERGTELFEELKEFSAETPLQLQDITRASQILLAFGTAAEDVTSEMRMLGDLAMGNAERMNRLVEAYGKLQAKGKATLEELNRFTEAGVPLMDALAEATGTSVAEVYELVTQGKVGFKDVQEALRNLTGEGGQFNGMMLKISQTVEGKFSTAVDNVKLALAEFGKIMLPMVKNILDGVIRLAKGVANWSDANKKLAITFGTIAAAIGPLMVALGMLSKFIVANPYVALATAIAGVVAVVVMWAIRTKEARDRQGELLDSTKEVVRVTNELSKIQAESQIRLQTAALSDQNQILERQKRQLAALRAETESATVDMGQMGTAVVHGGAAMEWNAKKAAELEEEIAGTEGRIQELNTSIRENQAAIVEYSKAMEKGEEATKGVGDAAEEMSRRIRSAIEEADQARKDAHEREMDRRNAEQLRNNEILAEFGLAQKTETEREIAGIQERMGYYIAAGVDRVAAEEWAAGEIEKIHERSAKAEADRQKAMREHNAETIAEFDRARMTDVEREIAAIEEKMGEYIAAGIERVEAEAWAAEEIRKVHERAAQQTGDAWGRAGRVLQQTMMTSLQMTGAAVGSYFDYQSSLIDQNEEDERKAAKEKAKLAQQEFKFRKAMTLTQIAVNTREAFTKALTAGPIIGKVLAGIVLALGAAQAAFVAAQKPPPMPKFQTGGLVTGPAGADAVLARVTAGEYVMPREQTAANMAELERMRAGGGGEMRIAPMPLHLELNGREIGTAMVEFIQEASERGTLRLHPRAVRAM